MVTRKIILRFGQSNENGYGDLDDFIALTGENWQHTGTYSNLWFWQNDPSKADSTQGQWIQLDLLPTRMNTIADPVAPISYATTPIHISAPSNVYARRTGPVLECIHGISAALDEPLYVVGLCVDLTYISRHEPITPALPQVSWFNTNAHRSWHPSLPYDDTPFTETVVDSGTSATASISVNVLSDSAASWTADEHAGHYLKIGAKTALILTNTATDLVIYPVITDNPWWPITGSAPSGAVDYTVVARSYFAASLLRALLDGYLTAAATAASPDTIEVVGVFGHIGESESLDAQRASLAGVNMRAIIDYTNQWLVDSGYAVRANGIPWVLTGVKEGVGWTYDTIVNQHYQDIAKERDNVRFVAATDAQVGGLTGSDLAHFNAQGVMLLGQLQAQAWLDIASATEDATDRMTLAELRTMVKRRYQRSTNDNSLTTQQLDFYINEGLRELCLQHGDNMWFLRKTERVAFGVAGSISTLPRQIRRVLEVTVADRPELPVDHRLYGHVDPGRAIMLFLPYATAGNYDVHYIALPKDLVAATDMPPLPSEYRTMLIAFACRRAAVDAGNMEHANMFAREAGEHTALMARDVQRHERQRHLTLDIGQGFDRYLYPFGGR